MAVYYGLGIGPEKKFQPLLARHDQLVSRTGVYEADTSVTYATDDIHMLTVPKGSVILDYWVWSPTGFGASCVVDLGEYAVATGTFTGFADASAVDITITDNLLIYPVLADGERRTSLTVDTILGVNVDSIVTQPAAGDYIVLGATYQTFQTDYPL